eukprot:363634-Chlamydomonas_euryale.AAC.8
MLCDHVHVDAPTRTPLCVGALFGQTLCPCPVLPWFTQGVCVALGRPGHLPHGMAIRVFGSGSTHALWLRSNKNGAHD